MGYLRGAAVWSGGILHGYESLGELSVRPADPTIDSSHALLVKSYCRGHPLERVASRADGFVFEMINWKALGSAVPVPSFRATPPNANPSGLLGHGSPGGQCGSWAAGASGGLADNIFQDLAAGVERRQPVVGRNPRQLQGAG